MKVNACGRAAVAFCVLSYATIGSCLEITDWPSSGVQIGETYTILYTPNYYSGVSFNLINSDVFSSGELDSLGLGYAGSFNWTVNKDIPEGKNYALQASAGSERNRTSNFALKKSTNTISTLITTTTGSDARTAVPNAAPTPTNSGHKTGLNTGVKVGIGVGASIAGLFLVVGAFMVGRLKRKLPPQNVLARPEATAWSKPELEGKTPLAHTFFAELEAVEVSAQEMRADKDAGELQGPIQHERAELLVVEQNSAVGSVPGTRASDGRDGGINRERASSPER